MRAKGFEVDYRIGVSGFKIDLGSGYDSAMYAECLIRRTVKDAPHGAIGWNAHG